MSISHRLRPPLPLVLAPLLIILLWFSKGLLFAGGEEGIPFYSLPRSLTIVSYIWREADTGFRAIWLLPKIPQYWFLDALFRSGVENVVLQAFTFLVLMLVGVLAVYFLIAETIVSRLKGGAKTLVPLLGALFYLLSPYSMTQVWGRGLYVQFFAFALIPPFLLFFIRAIKDRNFLYGGLAVLSSFFLSPAFVFPAQILVIWTPALLYLLFYILRNKKDRDKVLSALFTSVFIGVSFLLVHAWWLFPNILLAQGQYSFLLESAEHNLGSLRGVSRQFQLPVLIRLMHTGYFYEDLYGKIYSSPFFWLLSWLIPFVSLFSISTFKKLKYFKFYLVLFVISLFISLGSNFPTGRIFEWLFLNIPYLQAFRNPYEKFGLVFTLAYTPFFSLGVHSLAKKLSKSPFNSSPTFFGVIGVIMILVSGVYVWPMWTGQFAGGYKINPWIKVPSYYKEVDGWLANQEEGFRILHVPLLPGDGLRYNWPHPYQGLEPSEFLFGHPSISRNVGINSNKRYYNILLERFDSFQPNVFGPDPDTSNSTFRSKELYQELEKLAVRYIVLHRDLDEKITGSKSPEETAIFLEKQPKIKKVKTFGELDIYEVDISGRVARIYSPDAETGFTRYSPAHYEVDIRDSKGETELYFLDLFDPGWEAFVEGEKVNEHSRVFDYANAWRINKNGDYKVTVKYKPQEYVYAGMRISISTVILLTVLGIYLWRRKII